MKLIKLFLEIIVEAAKLSFTKQSTESTELPLPSDEVMNMNEEQREVWGMDVFFDFVQLYKVNLFTKWFLFTFLMFSLILNVYYFYISEPVFILISIASYVLYKLYYNCRCLAELRRCILVMTSRPIDNLLDL